MKLNKQQVLSEVMDLYNNCGDIIDAILVTCDKYKVEIETISHYIRYSKEIKEIILKQGTQLRLLKV